MDNEESFPFYRNGPPGSVYYPPNYYRTPFRPPSSSGTVNFPIIAIAILGIIATALLLICYYIFAVKFCLNWHRFGFLRRLSGHGSHRYRDPLIVFAATIHNSRGLDESVIRSIPIFQFKKGVDDGKEKKGNECAVCLSEFQEDERLRLLPGCSHAFHIDCIDRWLQTNANCPLCRCSITSIEQFARGGMAGNPVLPRPAGDHLVIEVSDGGSESSEDSSEMSSTQSSNSDQSPSPSELEQSNPLKRQKRFHHRPSMGDECIDVRRNKNRFGVQPLRRSFSVDSSSDRQLYLSVQETLQQNTQIQEAGSSSDTRSRSRRFFFPFGPGRGSRNAVLPIESEP